MAILTRDRVRPSPAPKPIRPDALCGLLVGTAVGDALGLPLEGVPRRLTIGLAGERPRHGFLFGRGMVSDDTEHAALTLRALAASGGDGRAFRSCLASELRFWFAAMPPGIGLATLKACARLCVGVSPERSGSPSAGNGAAMRAPVIGAAFPADEKLRHELVRISTLATHTDPRAWTSARALADLAAASVARGFPPPAADIRGMLVLPGDGKGWTKAVDAMLASLAGGGSTLDYALAVAGPWGVTGFVEHSVPVAMHAYLRHGSDFEGMMSAVLACGGDTDSVAALAGALFGAAWGDEAIPHHLSAGILDWPWNAASLRRLARSCRRRLDRKAAAIPRRPFLPLVLGRNLFLLAAAMVLVAARVPANLLDLRRLGR